MKMNTRKNVRGQGMSEYLIIVALIAVAGIAVMGLFGGAARNQVAGMALEISGQEGSGSTGDAQADATAAAADANTAKSLNNYTGGNAAIQ
ncbi:hypothetical protein A9Q81_24485 [Gammaproteobacteria bacterium 42_54_T18]|nr:hypothetical protein A9Q81_24485 [Gammaproteobacteria bacterium 42_54_T18]